MIAPTWTDLPQAEARRPWRLVDRDLWIREDGIEQSGAHQKASLSGELHLHVTRELADTLEEIVKRGARWLVLDIAGVTSLDPAAAGALAVVASSLESSGGRLKVRHARPRIGRSLEIVGLGRLLTHDD
jgi:anti-sigma B factor antagonist